MKLFQRIKKIIALSKKDISVIDKLSEKEINAIPDSGDGNAVFFGEPTLEEEKLIEREDKGYKGIFGL